MQGQTKTISIEIPQDACETVVLPRPTWARLDAICGRRGVVQISKALFYRAVNEGAVRFLKDGDAKQASCVYSVEDLERWVSGLSKTKAKEA